MYLRQNINFQTPEYPNRWIQKWTFRELIYHINANVYNNSSSVKLLLFFKFVVNLDEQKLLNTKLLVFIKNIEPFLWVCYFFNNIINNLYKYINKKLLENYIKIKNFIESIQQMNIHFNISYKKLIII